MGRAGAPDQVAHGLSLLGDIQIEDGLTLPDPRLELEQATAFPDPAPQVVLTGGSSEPQRRWGLTP